MWRFTLKYCDINQYTQGAYTVQLVVAKISYLYHSTSVLHFHQCLGSNLCKQITPEDHTRLNLPIKTLERFIGYSCSNTKYLVLVYIHNLSKKTVTYIHKHNSMMSLKGENINMCVC